MRKTRPTIFTLLLAALLLAACGERGASLADFSLRLYEPTYASGFEILGAEGRESSIVVTKVPWQGADSAAATRLFVQRGDEAVPSGFQGQVLRGEAQRIVCMSSTYIAMLDAVGAVDRVVGVSGIQFITNPAITQSSNGKSSNGKSSNGKSPNGKSPNGKSPNGQCLDVGYDGNVDYERLLSLAPDLVLLYGVNGTSGMDSKLRELGIPYMYVGEYLEESPLGKAEWLVAVAEAAGLREKGQTVFSAIPQRYKTLKDKAETAADRPRVMLNTPYGDQWVMPSTGSYIAQLIRDAGGEYVYRQNTSNQSMPIDMEEAYLLTASADVWVNVGQIASLDELTRLYPKFADTPPVQTHQVWQPILRATPGGGNDFWESGVVHPDLVLQDLLMMFHPNLLDAPFFYYKRLE